jgi:hypothetical protein
MRAAIANRKAPLFVTSVKVAGIGRADLAFDTARSTIQPTRRRLLVLLESAPQITATRGVTVKL